MSFWECPHCGSPLGAQTLSLVHCFDHCDKCGKSCRFPAGGGREELLPQATSKPWPSGVALTRNHSGWIVEASTRSEFRGILLSFAFLFVVCVIASIQTPEGAELLWTLFALVSAPNYLCLSAMRIAGRISIALEGRQVAVFTGAFGLGSRKLFDWSQLESVRVKSRHRGTGALRVVVLQADRTVEFGLLLRPDQRRFMIDFLFRERSRLRLASQTAEAKPDT